MEFISEKKISKELVNSFDEEMTLELAKRLEDDNYKTPFDGLNDWHLLRALAINRPEYLASFVSAIFSTISIAGWVIGSFSILVGGFGIANIMFVSVKERVPIIGLQKSLGAKKYFILMQFLFESSFLSIFGGLFGIFFVFLLTLPDLGSFDLVISLKNVIVGVSISSIG